MLKGQSNSSTNSTQVCIKYKEIVDGLKFFLRQVYYTVTHRITP